MSEREGDSYEEYPPKQEEHSGLLERTQPHAKEEMFESTRREREEEPEENRPLRKNMHSFDEPSPKAGCVELLHMGLTCIMWLIGVAIIILGALLVSDIRLRGLKSLQHLGPLQNAAILVIIIGAAILVIGIFGCISVSIKNKPMVLTFAVLLLLLMVLEVAACILAWYHKKGNTLEMRLNELIGRVIRQYSTGVAIYSGDDDWSFNRNALSFIEYAMHCCGANGYEDYLRRNIPVPTSCYHNDRYYNMFRSQDGCVEVLQDFIMKHGLILGLLCVLALVLQLVLIITSFIVVSRIPKDDLPQKRAEPPTLTRRVTQPRGGKEHSQV
ncbi:tetraspanin-9 [Galendromus occidentalis]|uniref:Tetraspanin-9 n=1 Tax=Galendromus occidentalis TaxID=34638 RepID=A0AAJ6QNF4_9ACAR|nr:tetraspanin-9 [Galendromus occidentalis]